MNSQKTKLFKEKYITKFGNRYDFSKIKYIDSRTKVCIICPEHGEFWVAPDNLLKGRGCPKCAGKYKTTQDVIKEFKEIHGDKYDYSKVEYKNAKTKVCIICPEHGEFWQTPNHHLSGNGCPKCRKNEKLTQDDFINQCIEKYGNKYDYSKVNYKTAKDKVCIICPEHGEFWVTPDNFIRKNKGCKRCGKYKVFNTDDFIRESIVKHGNRYDYSKVDYKTSVTPIEIICPDHGIFIQKPAYHLQGHKCPYCQESSLETEIRVLLENNNINYIYEKKFDWLKTEKGGKQSLDFYLPDYNIAIECQGLQHYKAISYFKGDINYTTKLDETKRNKCKENNIKLLYFTNKRYKKYDKFAFVEKEKLLEEIEKNKPNIL